MRYAEREYQWGHTHYANRRILLALHIRGCRKKHGPECGGAFKCTECGALVGWCRGGHEGSHRDTWCDGCWAKSERAKQRVIDAFNAHMKRRTANRSKSSGGNGNG